MSADGLVTAIIVVCLMCLVVSCLGMIVAIIDMIRDWF